MWRNYWNKLKLGLKVSWKNFYLSILYFILGFIYLLFSFIPFKLKKIKLSIKSWLKQTVSEN